MTTTVPQTHRILKAIAMAARAHQGQLRKDRITPYVSHVFRVCFTLRHIFGIEDEDVLIAAVLHDTVEDTTTDYDDVEEKFGSKIAEWVAQLSKDKRLPFAERERVYGEVLAGACWQVQVCKLADIHDNLLDSEHLSAKSRARSLTNADRYLSILRTNLKPQAEPAMRIVESIYQGLSQSG